MKKLQYSHPDATFWDQALVDDLFGNINGNIFVIPGEYEGEYIDRINQELNACPYAVVLLMSDESSNFPAHLLIHPRMRLWLQYPKEEADHYLPAGYSPACRNIKHVPKNLDWFWGGQVTHQDRFELVDQLRKLRGGKLIASKGFTQGVPPKEYLTIMARAKFVPCPRGNVQPDTLRMYEALELGCTPVIRTRDEQFYRNLLGEIPFLMVGDWSELGTAIEWYNDTDFGCYEWWTHKKEQMVEEMKEDIRWLSAS
jgi:hypothetical protein